MQISFPSASLLIKQLNGKRKVIQRFESVKEKDTRCAHTACTWTFSRAAVSGIQADWYSHDLAGLIFQCNQHALTHVSTSVLQQNISAELLDSLVIGSQQSTIRDSLSSSYGENAWRWMEVIAWVAAVHAKHVEQGRNRRPWGSWEDE